MKTMYTFLIFISSFFPSNELPGFSDCCPVSLSTSEFDVSYETKYYSMYFAPMKFDEESGNLLINSKVELKYIDVSNPDGSVWKLIVFSSNLQLSKDFFKSSDTKLSVYLEGREEAFDIFIDYK